MKSFVIQLLAYGVTGFAVILLGFCFRLYWRIINQKMSDIDINDNKDDRSFKLEQYKIGMNQLTLKLNAIKFFTIISLLFFIIGTGVKLFSVYKETSISINITPDLSKNEDSENIGYPMIKKGIHQIKLQEDGTGKVVVKEDNVIIIQLDNIMRSLNESRKNLNTSMIQNIVNNEEGM